MLKKSEFDSHGINVVCGDDKDCFLLSADSDVYDGFDKICRVFCYNSDYSGELDNMNKKINGQTLSVVAPFSYVLMPAEEIKFIEGIVLLTKERNASLLVMTCSFYALYAIEVCAAENDIEVAYWHLKDGILCNVSDNTERIYREFVVPLQRLETRRSVCNGYDA